MKRFISILLVLALMLSLVGCLDRGVGSLFDNDREETGNVYEEESVRETPVAETEPPAIPQVTVSDAYSDLITREDSYGAYIFCYHIPQFDIHTPEIEALNQEIYEIYYSLLTETVYQYPEQPMLLNLQYNSVQVEDIVCLLIHGRHDWGADFYATYYVYADGSGVVSRETLIERMGYSMMDYYNLVAEKMDEKYTSFFGQNPDMVYDSYYQLQHARTLSYYNVLSAVPFISVDGDLCCIATIYSLAGADSYDYLLNLSGEEEPDLPVCNHENG